MADSALKQKLTDDMKVAMRNKDKERLGVIRLALAAIKQREVDERIELDDTQLTGSSAYLFASILEHFFGLYCSINSFTRVLVKLRNKEGYLKKCPPRAGEKILL